MRRSKRDRRAQKVAKALSGVRQRHARRRMKARAGDVDYDAFRAQVLDGGLFERLEQQPDHESWLCCSECEGRTVYFILKDDPETGGREIATVLSKGMAMASFPQVFGSPGTHLPPEERERLQALDREARRVRTMERQIEALKQGNETLVGQLKNEIRRNGKLVDEIVDLRDRCQHLEADLMRRRSIGILDLIKERFLGKMKA